ncbi:hypothetical protein UA44_06425 [Klebsiella aerogenes]|nr:hypothetical protein UA44_15215 [Klebsiella aerogenes]KJF83745.1 hypothetical protein UA44_06425 [Klebsiella aerogenes]
MKQQQLKELVEQATILQQAEEDDAKLDSVLQSYGWGYDDLRYEDSYELAKDTSLEEYVTLDRLQKPVHNVPMVSFLLGPVG